MIVFEVPQGELVDELNRQAAEAGVTDAAIVSLIGAADSFTVSTMPEGDALKDTITKYDLPGEMTGTGEIRNGFCPPPRRHGRRRRPRYRRTPPRSSCRHPLRPRLRHPHYLTGAASALGPLALKPRIAFELATASAARKRHTLAARQALT